LFFYLYYFTKLQIEPFRHWDTDPIPKYWYPRHVDVSAQDCISCAPKCDYGTKVPGIISTSGRSSRNTPGCRYGFCPNMAENGTYHNKWLYNFLGKLMIHRWMEWGSNKTIYAGRPTGWLIHNLKVLQRAWEFLNLLTISKCGVHPPVFWISRNRTILKVVMNPNT
jgi:hypothetical protein